MNSKCLLGIAALVALVGTPALAADMALKAPPAPVFSWSGCYVGGNLGGGFDRISTERTGQVGIPLATQDYGSDTGSAFVGGGQIGCDYQVKSWVVGIRGEADWGRINSSHIIPPFPTFSYNTMANDFAALTGRVGYTLMPQALLYVDAGGAYKRDHLDVTIPAIGFLSEFADANFVGWTVGVGLEWMIMSNLSFFVEYNFMDFGTKSVTFTTAPGAVGAPDIINHSQNDSTILAGFNIRCCASGWGSAMH
jgi:outer membrane immunogenic protein